MGALLDERPAVAPHARSRPRRYWTGGLAQDNVPSPRVSLRALGLDHYFTQTVSLLHQRCLGDLPQKHGRIAPCRQRKAKPEALRLPLRAEVIDVHQVVPPRPLHQLAEAAK